MRAAALAVALALFPLAGGGAVAHAHEGHAPHDPGRVTDDHHTPHQDTPHSDHAPLPLPRPFGPDAPLRDLAAELAAATPGAALHLPPGTYRGDLVIERAVTLDGHGAATILGDGTGTVLVIRAAGTVIRGVHVVASGPGPTGNPSGIRIEADDVRIEGVVVQDTYHGITVVGADRVHLVGNRITGRQHAPILDEGHALDSSTHEAGHPGGRGDGVSLWDTDGVLVRDNLIEGTRDGIYLSFGSSALLDRNHVHDSRYAVHSMYAQDLVLAENHLRGNLSGAVLMYGGPVLLLRNEIVGNRSPSTGFGVLAKDVESVDAVQNLITGNRVGLHVDLPLTAAEPARFSTNTVARNQIGVVVHSTTAAVFRGNSFAENTVQVHTAGRGAATGVVWADRGAGNFWSTYRGFDLLGEGRGAVPHREGSSVEATIARAPVLTALATSPGFRLIRAMEDRWAVRGSTVVDELPLTVPWSPPVPTAPRDPLAAVLLGIAGAGLVAGPLWRIRRLRHPARTAAGRS